MRKSLVLIALALSLLVISPIVLVAAQPPYPVSGATVSVSGTNGQGSATTDSNGNFSITQGLGAGFYDVDVGAPGYISVNTNATVAQGVTTNMGDIYLNVSARVTGTVQTPSGGAAAGILVELYDQSNSTVAGNITQSDGTFIIDTDVPTGTYSVLTYVYSGQPYASAPILTGVSAVQGQTTSVGILKLTQSGTIAGTVTNSLDNGVAGVTITAVGANGQGYATTNSSGQYSITSNLGTGSYNVTASGSVAGYVVNSSDVRIVSVTAELTTTVNFGVQNSGSISGTITFANGNPAQGVYVTAYSTSGFYGSAITKSDGTYLINSGLGTGMYTVIAGSDYVDTQTASVTAGSLTPNVNIQLDYNLAWIAGKVSNATAPLSSAELSGTFPPTGFASAFTYLNGTYLMEVDIPSGQTSVQVNVTASAKGYADASQVATATVGQTTSNVDFTLQAIPGGSLEGRVVTNTPPPLQNAVLALSPSSNSITLGSQLILSGTLSPAQTGNVTIYESINGSTWTELTSVALSGGSYHYAFGPSALGTYTFYASWLGNAQYNPANSSTIQVIVSQVVLQNAVLSVQPSALSISLGSSLTISGTLSPTQSGTVTIWESINGSAFTMLNEATLANGNYNYTFSPSIGSYQFYSSWPGNSQYNPANSTTTSVTVAQVVLQNAVLTIQASASSITVGSSLTVSGTLSPTQSGTVTIWESINGSAFTALTTATLSSGSYSYKFNPSAVGSYQFYSSWPGNSQYNPANSSTTISVSVTAVPPTTPTLTLKSSASSVTPGQTVTLSGTISPSATGTVTLSESVNGSAYQQIATPALTSGAYSYQYVIPGNGTYKFEASFAGNSQLNPAQSSAATVTSAKTTSSSNTTLYIIIAVIVVVIIIAAVYYMVAMRPKTEPAK